MKGFKKLSNAAIAFKTYECHLFIHALLKYLRDQSESFDIPAKERVAARYFALS